jgi:hypothetical protein
VLLAKAAIHCDCRAPKQTAQSNIGFSGHKKVKGDKIVAFCDRNCNVAAPFSHRL